MTDGLVRYILNDREPVLEPDVEKWGKWFRHGDKEVAETIIEDTKISTYFLGIDYNHRGGTPILFETAIFSGARYGETHRYETWEQAEKGHERTVIDVLKRPYG